MKSTVAQLFLYPGSLGQAPYEGIKIGYSDEFGIRNENKAGRIYLELDDNSLAGFASSVQNVLPSG